MGEVFGFVVFCFSKWALSKEDRTPNSGLESICFVLSVEMCFKIGTFVCPYNRGYEMYLQKCLFCHKRSVLFTCIGWISPPQRNPVCVLELSQLCFLMLCDLICPLLLLLALRLIFTMCSACASNTEPVCEMALRLGRHTAGNNLYLVACKQQ